MGAKEVFRDISGMFPFTTRFRKIGSYGLSYIENKFENIGFLAGLRLEPISKTKP